MTEAILTPAQRDELEAAIEHAETTTDGELVTAVAYRCGNPFLDAVLIASLLALCAPALIWWFLNGTATSLYSTQVLTLFVALWTLNRWPALRYRLWPKAIKQERVRRHAIEQFYQLGLHRTAHRRGVLIFVSLEEKRVEILADVGFDEAVSPVAWQRAVNALVARVQRGEVFEGYLDTVRACAEVMATAAPASTTSKKILVNHLIVIDP